MSAVRVLVIVIIAAALTALVALVFRSYLMPQNVAQWLTLLQFCK